MSARRVPRWPGLRLLLACAGLTVVAGCGDPELWTRYRAERDFWHAARAIDRIRVNPRLASDEDFARAARAFRRVVDALPAARWATPAGLARPYGRDLATLSGQAAIAALRFGEHRGAGGTPEAFAQLATDYAAVPEVRREALAALARSLQAADRWIEEAAAWSAVWAESEPVDARREQVEPSVLEAPFAAARALRLAGRETASDSLLAAARDRLVAAAERWRGRRPGESLWRHAANAAALADDRDGAIAALRGALGELDAEAGAPLRVTIAEHHLQSGRPDSALVYTAWAARDLDGGDRSAAALVAARAWVRLGRPDSALGGLSRLVDGARIGSEGWVQVRFARAEILEQMGRWEQARGEYRTVTAAAAMHALGLRAQTAIVRHHAEAGERGLAEIEARHAFEAVARLLEMSRDDDVRIAAGRARAEVFEVMGDDVRAIESYSELWRRYPRSIDAGRAGLQAAALARRRGERARADSLYRELAQASEPELRSDARKALGQRSGAMANP